MRRILQSDVLPLKIGAIGDSLCASLGSNAYYGGRQYAWSNQPLFYAMLSSVGGWEATINAGVAGQRSDQILARISSDIIASGVDVCVINSCFWNDYAQGYTASFTQGNIVAMCDQLRAASILPVLCTPTPDAITGGTSARKLYMSTMAAWVRSYGLLKGYPVDDYLSPLIDVSTGSIAGAFSLDGSVHPLPAGFAALGQSLATVLDAIAGRRAYSLACYAADATDLLAGKGLFLSGSGTGTGWTATTPSGGVNSLVTDAAVLGQMQQLAATATAGTYLIDSGNISGWSVGDTLELSGIITNSGGTAVPRLRFLFGGAPNPNNYLIMEPAAAVTRGRFRAVQTIPAGVTSLQVRLQMQNGTGTVAIGQLALRNLTTLGVA